MLDWFTSFLPTSTSSRELSLSAADSPYESAKANFSNNLNTAAHSIFYDQDYSAADYSPPGQPLSRSRSTELRGDSSSLVYGSKRLTRTRSTIWLAARSAVVILS